MTRARFLLLLAAGLLAAAPQSGRQRIVTFRYRLRVLRELGRSGTRGGP